MTPSELKQKLQQPYDRAAWQTVLLETFPNVSILAQPHAVLCENQDVASFLELGSVRLHDDKKLAIFEIVLTPKKKIQRNRVELRNLVAKYVDQETSHGVLVIFTGEDTDYRLTFTAKESEFNDDGEFIERQTATKRFTYLLGPHETCTTAARRLTQLAEKQDRATLADVVEAFSVEKLNKEFFTLYKEHYITFVNYLLAGDVPKTVFGIPQLADEKEQDKANKPVRDFAKRLLGRLVFLYFLQKKGWLGCPADRTDWTEGDRKFVRNLFLTCPDKGKFYSSRLVPLFFEALNRPDRPNALFPVTGTRVPYLNGGLFEHEKLPNDHNPLPVEQLDFPATLFDQLLDFFGQYNFTIDENDPDDHEVGIDPEMLGHIFENLLEDNKDKGAFYTPKAIVQYMCQQSLIHYLQQHLGVREEIVNLVRFKDAGSPTDKNNWIRRNARRIEELLDRLKICDPAIGSGAFPIGLLQEIYWLKLTLDWTLDPAETKLKIIQNSIYGVDIDAGAVEIARLRFWLSLIVDEDEPRPLPNLDYKIMQGDSLLESFEGIPLDQLHEIVKVTPILPGQLTMGFAETQMVLTTNEKTQEITKLTHKYFSETDPSRKQDIHRRIDRFVLDHIDYNLLRVEENLSDELIFHQQTVTEKQKQLKGWEPPNKLEKRIALLEEELKSIALKRAKLQELEEKAERPYFLWHLFFQDVFEDGGFDIFIANPPYVRQEAIKAKKPDLERGFGGFYCGTADLYTYFFKLGIDKLKPNGHLCYIAPNKFMRAGYGKNTRILLATEATPKVVLDFGDLPIFDATTYPSILLVEKSKTNPPSPPCQGGTKGMAGIAPSPDKGRAGEGFSFLAATFTDPAQLRRLEDTIANVGFTMPVSALKAEGWSLERPDVLALMEKLRKSGKPLGEYVDGKFYRGVLTGLNEAFVIDEATRQRLIAEDPGSAEIIKPWLRGRDIKKWQAQWAGLHIIAIASSGNKEWPWSKEETETTARPLFEQAYPAIHRHLSQWEDGLRKRDDQGRFWWELRACVYWDEFARPKISWSHFATVPEFVYDEEGFLSNDKSYIMPAIDLSVLGILNSKITNFFLSQLSPPVRGGYMELRKIYLEQLPISSSTDIHKAPIIERVQQILAKPNSQEIPRLEAEVDKLVYELYGLTEEEISIVERARAVQEPPDKKSILTTRILPSLKGQSAYFSLAAVKRALTAAEIELAGDTLREYMSEAMSSAIVSDAGRGWYSRHTKPVSLDPKPVSKIIREVKKAFPLLDFCCWSTVQFNHFALHLIAQPTIFLYTESDALETVAGFLKKEGWDAWSNPGKSIAERFVHPGDRTVVLRPAIVKQPEAKDHVAPIEKALVDLVIEAQKLKLLDTPEVQRIIDTALGAGLLQLAVLLAYADEKREKFNSQEVTH